MNHETTPANPGAGTIKVYAKSDNSLYTLTSGGTETQVGGSLQQGYNVSTTPEILTDATRGALTVKRGSAADTDNVLEVQNGAGSTTAAITGNGTIVTSLTASRAIVTDGSSNLSTSATTATELGYVSGVTSAIQTQLDSKAASSALTSHTGASTGVHGVTGAVVGTTDTQTLSAKTLTNPIIDDGLRINHETSVTTPASGKVSLFAKSDNRLYVTDSTGAATPVKEGDPTPINYISNPTFENGTTAGWSTYVSTTPPDTTFNPSTTLTLSANTTNPLHGTYDLKVVKPASFAQDHGFSYDFSVDSPNRSSKLIVSFDQNTTDSDYVTGDILIYVYDIDAMSYVLSDVSLKKEFITGSFAFAFNPNGGTNFKLLFHWTGTATTAVDLYFDNFRITPVNPTTSVTTGSQLTSQTNCVIDTADINNITSSLVLGVNHLQIVLNGVTITGGASSFSFTLPESIARPANLTTSVGIVYDANVLVTGTMVSIVVDTGGGVTFSKVAGGTFTGGSNNSYARAMLFWII
jgi:hypothetical protein